MQKKYAPAPQTSDATPCAVPPTKLKLWISRWKCVRRSCLNSQKRLFPSLCPGLRKFSNMRGATARRLTLCALDNTVPKGVVGIGLSPRAPPPYSSPLYASRARAKSKSWNVGSNKKVHTDNDNEVRRPRSESLKLTRIWQSD